MLPVQVRDIHPVKVNEMQMAHADSGQEEGHIGAKAAQPGNSDSCPIQLSLNFRRMAEAKGLLSIPSGSIGDPSSASSHKTHNFQDILLRQHCL